jgi:hypothetical protein
MASTRQAEPIGLDSTCEVKQRDPKQRRSGVDAESQAHPDAARAGTTLTRTIGESSIGIGRGRPFTRHPAKFTSWRAPWSADPRRSYLRSVQGRATNWTRPDPEDPRRGGRRSLTPTATTPVTRTSGSGARPARGLHTRSGTSPTPALKIKGEGEVRAKAAAHFSRWAPPVFPRRHGDAGRFSYGRKRDSRESKSRNEPTNLCTECPILFTSGAMPRAAPLHGGSHDLWAAELCGFASRRA